MPPGHFLGEVFWACLTMRKPRGRTRCSLGLAGGGGWELGGLGVSAQAAASTTWRNISGRNWMGGWILNSNMRQVICHHTVDLS